MLAILAAAVLASATSCNNVGGTLPDPAYELFEDGYKEFDASNWRRADELFTLWLRQYSTTAAASEVYYYRGLARQKLGRRDDARRDFKASINAKGRTEIVALAKVALANLYYEEGNDAPAVHLYADVLKNPPKGIPLDVVIYRHASSLQRLGKWADADRHLEYMINHYPKSSLIPDARRRLGARFFTVQVGAFSKSSGAEEVAGRVRSAGFRPWLAIITSQGRTLHAVRVGKTATYAEAYRLQKRLEEKGFTTYIVP